MAIAAVISGVTTTSGTAVSVVLSTPASGGPTGGTVGRQGVEISTSTTFSGTATVYSTATTIAVSSGLTAGLTYYFRVSGYTSGGTVPVTGTSSNVIGPFTMVATPTAPTIIANNGSMSVTFITSVTGATTYTIQRDTITGFSAPTTVATGLTSSPYVDNTVLTKGTSYYYRLIGVASNNTVSANGAPSAAAVYATVPDAPTVTTAAATTTAAVTVNWTAPASTGGSAITYYKVNYSTDNSTDTSTWPLASATIGSTLRTFSVTGLSAATVYYFCVSAINARGTSLASNSLQCSTLAAAPTAVVSNYVDSTDAATTGNSASGTKMSVSFTAPTGTAITGYTVYSSVGGLTATGTSSPIVISGLTQGTSYTFTVKAATKNSSNVDQLSAASSASVARTAALAPGDMGTVTVGTRTTVATPLSWTAVAGNGLTTNYKIERYDASASSPSWSTIVTSQTAVIYAGATLTANNQYTWRVTPFTVAGSGLSSNEVTAWTLPNVSIQPTTLSLKPESSISILVSTTASAVLGQNYYIIPYLNGVTAQNGLGGTTDLRVTHTGTGVPISNIEVPNLTAGASYKFATQSYNSNETVAVSTLSTATIVPGIVPGLPTGTLAVSAQTSAAITINGFSKPSDFGSYADITGYTIERSINGTAWTNAIALANTATFYPYTGLLANTSYWFRIAAKNASGTGAYRYLVTSGDDTVAPASAPTGTLQTAPSGTPTVTSVSNGDGTATLTITYNALDGASYRAVPYLAGTTEVTASISSSDTPGAGSKTLSVIVPEYLAYTVKVASVNRFGLLNYGAASSIVYLGNNVSAPSGNAYSYNIPTYTYGSVPFSDSNVTYTGVAMADVTFDLTTVNGASAWKITRNSDSSVDTLIGVRKVILTDTTVVLFGANSDNKYLDAAGTNYQITSVYSITNGAHMLFAAGETYERTSKYEWDFNCSVTMKGVGVIENIRSKPIIEISGGGVWTPHIVVSNVTIQDIVFSSKNRDINNNMMFVASTGGYPMQPLSNITLKGVEFTDMSGSKGVSFHYVTDSLIEDCKFGACDTYSLNLETCSNIVIKNSTIARSLIGSVMLGASSQTYLAATSSASFTPSGPLASLFGVNGNVDVNNNICYYLINRNIDMSIGNTFSNSIETPANKPFINIDSQRYQNYEILKDADGIKITDASGNYYFDFTKPLSLSQTFTNSGEAGKHIKLPAAFGYSFMWDYSLATMQAGISSSYYRQSTGLRVTPLMTDLLTGMKQQMPRYTFVQTEDALAASETNAPAIVTNLSTGARIYPAGYELAPGVPVVTATTSKTVEGSVDLSWSAVAANASGMHSTEPYSVLISSTGGAPGSYVVSGTTASVTGLTSGVEYTFTVTAKNSASLTSTSSPAYATPANLPGAPTDLIFTPHDTAISVSGMNLAVFGAGATSIESYRVRVYSDANGATEISSKMTESLSLLVMVAGLSDNVDYYFSMAVKNNVMTEYGPESVISAAQRTVTSPGEPQDVTVTAGYNRIIVGWKPPVITGGNTSFTYKVRIAGIVGDIPVTGETLTIDSSNFSSITAGQSYSVAVCAVGDIDKTPGSFSVFKPVVPFAEPGAPVLTATTTDNTSITLNWTTPDSNDGAQIQEYKVYKSDDNGSTYNIVSNINGLVSNLLPNSSYMFKVSAHNTSVLSTFSNVFTLDAAPVITLQPVGGTITIGSSLPLSVGHTGGTPQWYKNGSLIVGATGNAYSANSAGNYKVRVTSASGRYADSNTVTVNAGENFINPLTDESTVIVSSNIQKYDGSNKTAMSASSPTPTPGDFSNVPNPSNPSQNLPETRGIVYSLPNNTNNTTASNTALERLIKATVPATPNDPPGVILFNGMMLYAYRLPKETVSAVDPTDPNNGNIVADLTEINKANPFGIAIGLKTSADANGKLKDNISIKAIDNNGATIPLPTYQIPLVATYPTSRVLQTNGVVYNQLEISHTDNNPGGVTVTIIFTLDSTDITTTVYKGILNINNNTEVTPSNSTPPPPPPAICFLGNTPIQTPTGYRRIDRLCVGDKVMTADGRTVAIQRVFKKNYEPSVTVNPYVIPKGQFGATENVMISPEHRVAVTGRGLVEAHKLGLKQMSMRAAFDYYNLELPTWESDNMVAAGVEVESLAPVRRLEITKAEFTALLKAKYGKLTPDVIARACRTCFMTADGKVNIPTLKRK